ncbi:hypothetical protein ACFVUS_24135 [Nocardia sp. NPDC058058]|uniref:hypothetical protein n=1 Tax=Nocardia sp. NPDC058058 TaxID=3346317 RepID=UPI0036D7EB87
MPENETLTSIARRLATGDLSAVADLGGWRALDVDDQGTLQQMLRDLSAAEAPRPLSENNGDLLCNWVAVPTGDHAALLDELGLTWSIPATQDLADAASGSGVVYVTPQWDGWTLIYGHAVSIGSTGSTPSELEQLSLRFGAAHWYGADYGCDGWAMAENGKLVRLCMFGDALERDTFIGEPHRAEVDAILTWRADIDYDEDDDGRPRCGPAAVAAYGSVDPTAVGPHTRVQGHGLIAVPNLAAGLLGMFPVQP